MLILLELTFFRILFYLKGRIVFGSVKVEVQGEYMGGGVQGDKAKETKKESGTIKNEIQKGVELREAVPPSPNFHCLSAVACGSLIFPSFQPKG